MDANVNTREKFSLRANVGLFSANVGRLASVVRERLHIISISSEQQELLVYASRLTHTAKGTYMFASTYIHVKHLRSITKHNTGFYSESHFHILVN